MGLCCSLCHADLDFFTARMTTFETQSVVVLTEPDIQKIGQFRLISGICLVFSVTLKGCVGRDRETGTGKGFTFVSF